jgi:hypothetical protein
MGRISPTLVLGELPGSFTGNTLMAIKPAVTGLGSGGMDTLPDKGEVPLVAVQHAVIAGAVIDPPTLAVAARARLA